MLVVQSACETCAFAIAGALHGGRIRGMSGNCAWLLFPFEGLSDGLLLPPPVPSVDRAGLFLLNSAALSSGAFGGEALLTPRAVSSSSCARMLSSHVGMSFCGDTLFGVGLKGNKKGSKPFFLGGPYFKTHPCTLVVLAGLLLVLGLSKLVSGTGLGARLLSHTAPPQRPSDSKPSPTTRVGWRSFLLPILLWLLSSACQTLTCLKRLACVRLHYVTYVCKHCGAWKKLTISSFDPVLKLQWARSPGVTSLRPPAPRCR